MRFRGRGVVFKAEPCKGWLARAQRNAGALCILARNQHFFIARSGQEHLNWALRMSLGMLFICCCSALENEFSVYFISSCYVHEWISRLVPAYHFHYPLLKHLLRREEESHFPLLQMGWSQQSRQTAWASFTEPDLAQITATGGRRIRGGNAWPVQ